MSRPSHCLQMPISWQAVRRRLVLCGIEPGLLRWDLAVLTAMPPLTKSTKFYSILIPFTAAQDLPWIHCSSQSQRSSETFVLAPSSSGIKSNQSTWYQPWAAAHLSPLPGHPIPTLFTDPPVTIWPSPKVGWPFGRYVHPRLGSRPRNICTHLNRTKYTKPDPSQGQAGEMKIGWIYK